MDSKLETTTDLKLDFHKLKSIAAGGHAVVPVAVQDARSGRVLIVAYANEAALEHTLKHKIAALWSTSRGELWVKGATSGDYLDLVEARVNCEQNSLLYLVTPRNTGACHTRNAAGETRPSCYYRRISADGSLETLPEDI